MSYPVSGSALSATSGTWRKVLGTPAVVGPGFGHRLPPVLVLALLVELVLELLVLLLLLLLARGAASIPPGGPPVLVVEAAAVVPVAAVAAPSVELVAVIPAFI
jgi:hypothetical protein